MHGDREARRLSAERLAESARQIPTPYPSREAVDPVDAGLLLAAEQFDDPEWIARVWLGEEEAR